jgi:amino acid transporter
VAILISSAIFALLAFQTMAQLLTVYVWLRILVTVLTVLSAWRIRRLQPELKRPFRIPWGTAGLAYVVIAPLLMSAVALVGSDKFALKWGPIPVALGIVAYFVFPRIRDLLQR